LDAIANAGPSWYSSRRSRDYGWKYQISTDFARDRWFTAPEAVSYGLANEVIGGPAGAPESGTPA
jgi:ATP-dependent protease ClpP protease subunit